MAAVRSPSVDTERVPVTGGVRVAVDRWDGEPGRRPFLLVHGLASNARLWDGVVARLRELGHPVATVDQRGHGRSDKPDAGYDMGTVAADMRIVVEHLGWDRPVVAGQSWGGNVVLELAASWPAGIAGVACVDGGWIELQRRFPDWEEARDRMAPPPTAGTPRERIESYLRGAHPDWPEGGIQGALACFEVRDDGTVAPWLTLERHLLVLRGLWEHHPSSLYAEVGAPVLLVPADTGDEGWTAEKRQAVEEAEKALASCRTHWFTGDHDIHAQHPVALADLLAGGVEDGFFR